MNGQLTDQKSIAAATMYCQIRAIEYTKIFAIIAAGFVGVLVSSGLAWVQIGQLGAVIVFTFATVLWAVPSFRLYSLYAERLTWPEVESLKPALLLSAEQAVYLQCLQSVDESSSIVSSEKSVWASRLNATLDALLSGDEKAGQTLIRARDALVKQGQINSELEEIKQELNN